MKLSRCKWLLCCSNLRAAKLTNLQNWQCQKHWFSSKKLVSESYGSLRQKKADAFLENLSQSMLKRKEHIVALHQHMKDQHSLPGHDDLSPIDMHYLLTECHTDENVKKYFRETTRSNRWKFNFRKSREEKRLARLEKENMNTLAFTVKHDYRETFLRKFDMIRPFLFGQSLVFDLDYDLTRREKNRSYEQALCQCYAENYAHPNGFHLHFTSIDKHERMYEEFQTGLLDPYLVDFHVQPFWELFPLKDLVYLSPDAPMLENYDGRSVYVIGGFEDIDGDKKSSFAKAKSLGIRCGSIPLSKFGSFTGKGRFGRSLPLKMVMNIMLNVSLTHCWRTAIQDTLPTENFIMLDRKEKKKYRKIKKKFLSV